MFISMTAWRCDFYPLLLCVAHRVDFAIGDAYVSIPLGCIASFMNGGIYRTSGRPVYSLSSLELRMCYGVNSNGGGVDGSF